MLTFCCQRRNLRAVERVGVWTAGVLSKADNNLNLEKSRLQWNYLGTLPKNWRDRD